MLAFQMMLTERQGLPLSRLLRLRETDARSLMEKVRRLEEKSASPVLMEVKEEKEKMLEGESKEEGVRCDSMGASTGGSTLFTPRSFSPSSHPFPQVPPFFPPCFPPPHMPCYNPPQCGQMPWLHLWGMPVVGHSPALCSLVIRCFPKTLQLRDACLHLYLL